MAESPSIWTRLRGLFGKKPEIAQTPEPAAKKRPAKPSADTPAKKVGATRKTPVAVPTVDLVMGVDLGTSCTKVVIGDPGWQNRSFAVPFGDTKDGISAWLHPTRFGSETNLKMRLMDAPDSTEERDFLACYLAQVIIHSRKWFAANGPADYRRREIHWRLNLGFPGKTVSDTALAGAYREVARVAARLASETEQITRRAAARFRKSQAEAESRIEIYPEIAAQLAGYVNSPYRRAGNLLLVDVGAGTLDVSTIILHGTDEQDVVSFHFCEVASLGVLRLYQARAEALERVKPQCMKHPLDYFQDGSRPIPENLKEMVGTFPPALRREFERVSSDFSDQAIRVALTCLTRFRISQRKVHHNPSADPWGNNLRFFLTGGGSRSAFYRQALAGGPLEDRLSGFTRWHREEALRRSDRQGLVLESLPLPSNLEVLPKSLHEHFDRLSVAYGLAFGGENLMRITTSIVENSR